MGEFSGKRPVAYYYFSAGPAFSKRTKICTPGIDQKFAGLAPHFLLRRQAGKILSGFDEGVEIVRLSGRLGFRGLLSLRRSEL